MSHFPYVTVDVFAADRFGGNPLAVVTDARGLDDRRMLRIAAEFNYSETTFVLPADDPGDTARVRIFTRTVEVPFAGHPSVGTACVLGRLGDAFGRPVGDAMRLVLAAGRVEVSLMREAGAVVGARIAAPQPLSVGPEVDPGTLAACVSLPSTAVSAAHHVPTLASVGLPFVLAEVAPDALAHARPDVAAFRRAAERHLGDAAFGGRFSVFVYARTDAGIERLRARMFAPLGGTTEDPATGSASAALGAFLLSLDPRSDARASIALEQGAEMGRPSRIDVEVDKHAGTVTSVRIAGRCVPVMRGTLEA
jgi:trans-2,3-dihydro-3-hydroxyanthranilate isomerase